MTEKPLFLWISVAGWWISVVWTIAVSIKVRPANSLSEMFLLQPSPGAQGLSARFTATAVQKTNLLPALVFLTGDPADALGPWSAERPSHSSTPLPPSRSAEWIYCHCRNFCRFSKGEREETGSEGAVWDFFSSADARTRSLSNPEGLWNQLVR